MNKLSEHVLAYDDAEVSWCPTMDLIGVISAQERLVEIYRCGTKLQRLFVRDGASSPTAFAFADHGKLCVIGYEDGRVDVLKTDTAVEVFQFQAGDGADNRNSGIQAMLWKSSTIESHKIGQNLFTPTSFGRHLNDLLHLESKMENETQSKLEILDLSCASSLE